jgi:hypothetical protein
MGEAKQRAQREAAQFVRFGSIDFPRVAAAVRRLMTAASPQPGADALAHADLARHLLRLEGLDSETVIGFAAWRVGSGDGDVVIHGGGHDPTVQIVRQRENELAFHAWVETGGHVFDVTTYQLASKAAELDRLDGKTTSVTWCPDFILVRREELTSFARVRQEVAGLMYYERDAYLQGVVRKRAPALDPGDLGALEFLYRNPAVEVRGPRG